MKRRLMRACTVADKAMDVLGGTLFFLMVALVGFNVISFWLTKRRYGELEELVVSCLVWVSYISLGSHYRKKECIRADFLLSALSLKWQKILDVLIDIASFIIGSVVLYYGFMLMIGSMRRYTGTFKIPYFYIVMGLVIGFVSLLVNIVLKHLPDAGEGEGD